MSLADNDNLPALAAAQRGERLDLSYEVGYFVDERNIREAQAQAHDELVFPITYKGGILFRDGLWIKDDKTHFLGPDIPNRIFWQDWQDKGGLGLPKCLAQDENGKIVLKEK